MGKKESLQSLPRSGLVLLLVILMDVHKSHRILIRLSTQWIAASYLKPSTVYSCPEDLNGQSLNFEYNLDVRRAEPSDNLKILRQILAY